MAMKMSLTQSSIDEALEAYVRTQMPALPEETPVSIKLRATRGANGYTADITMGEEAPKTLGAAKKIGAAKRQKAAAAPAPAPVVETAQETVQEEETVAEPAVESIDETVMVEEPAQETTESAESEEEAVSAAPTPSIFGGLKTPA